jgi:hypothetical protein
MDYRCYDGFVDADAAEKFLREAKDRYGVRGFVVASKEEHESRGVVLKYEGCGKYPFVLVEQGFGPGGSGNFIGELADLAKTFGAEYEYS